MSPARIEILREKKVAKEYTRHRGERPFSFIYRDDAGMLNALIFQFDLQGERGSIYRAGFKSEFELVEDLPSMLDELHRGLKPANCEFLAEASRISSHQEIKLRKTLKARITVL